MTKGTLLATGHGISITLEKHPFYRTHDGRLFGSYFTAMAHTPAGKRQPIEVVYSIPEVVSVPHQSLPGEMRPNLTYGIRQTQQVRGLLSNADRYRDGVTLTSLFPQAAGWTVTESGRRIVVMPAVDHEADLAYTQYTAGVPLDGGNGFLDFVESHIAQPGLSPVAAMGRNFGKFVAARYASELIGRQIDPDYVPFLSVVPGISEVWFYSRLLFIHAIANPLQQRIYPNLMVKNMLWVAARTPFADIHFSLREASKSFFMKNSEAIASNLDAVMQRAISYLAGKKPVNLTGLLQIETLSGRTVLDYVTAILQGETSSGYQVSQNEAVGIDDVFYLDNNDGRLSIGLVVLEAREFGKKDSTPHEIQQNITDVARQAQIAYGKAEFARSASFSPSNAITRITTSDVTRLVIPVLKNLVRQGAISFMKESTSDQISERLGAYAMGAPFPSRVIDDLQSSVNEVKTALDNPTQRTNVSFQSLVELHGHGMKALSILRGFSVQSTVPGGRTNAGPKAQYSTNVGLAITQNRATNELSRQLLQEYQQNRLTPGTEAHTQASRVLRTHDRSDRQGTQAETSPSPTTIEAEKVPAEHTTDAVHPPQRQHSEAKSETPPPGIDVMPVQWEEATQQYVLNPRLLNNSTEGFERQILATAALLHAASRQNSGSKVAVGLAPADPEQRTADTPRALQFFSAIVNSRIEEFTPFTIVLTLAKGSTIHICSPTT